VHIDDAQLAWFKRTLHAAASRPVVVFSHAPPQGSGLTVIQARMRMRAASQQPGKCRC
jgi:hypothetical protein